MRTYFVIAVAALLVGPPVIAGDPDNFSGRKTKAGLANDKFNVIINKYLQAAVDGHNAANGRAKACRREMLEWILEDTLDRNLPDFYSDVYYADDPPESVGPATGEDWAVGKAFPTKQRAYAPSYRVKDAKGKEFLVGFDKIDHLFSHGYLNWKVVDRDPILPRAKIEKTLDLSMEQENGPWGSKGFGIKSYADLVANYEGTKLWRDLLAGEPPYFVCKQGNYVLVRKFDLTPYLNEGMDEAINCSSFATRELRDVAVKDAKAQGFTCPTDLDACARLRTLYSDGVAEKLLHPLCLGKESDQVEVPSALTTRDILDMASALTSGGENLWTVMFPPERKAAKPHTPVKGVEKAE